MIRKYSIQVLELTQKILEQYWQGNQTLFREHMHRDILWIGSMKEEYIYGAKDMLKRLDENHEEMPPVFLDEQEYEIVQNERNTCVVAGRYRAYTKPESGLLLSEYQRVTFVWEKSVEDKKDCLRIKHIHLSNTLHIQSEDERFPTKAGRESYEYLQRIMAERSMGDVITVKDDGQVTRVINYSDIMYVESDRNYNLIHMKDNNIIRTRGRFSDIVEILPDTFVSLNRSICVNRSYVKGLEKQTLQMIDGTTFKIAVNACPRIRKEINTNIVQK